MMPMMNSPTQPRIGQDKRQRLKQRKKDNDFKLATWNVRILLRTGGLKSLTDALRTAKLDITAIQETRWPTFNFGLKSNDGKMEYMVVSSSDRQYGPMVTINEHNFKVVDNFVYLGSQVNSKNDIVAIRRRVTLGNRCY